MTTAPALRGRRRPVTISAAALYTATAVFRSSGSMAGPDDVGNLGPNLVVAYETTLASGAAAIHA
ncbi:hypothetical protein PI124_g17652 [Phytophthora idaei]|nr:hypothetical protein PI125_g18339 [Phytophthora idaei]KAG3137223.1 hypothetical protein PI126_g17476 [Phytophthora idaei]KAG3237360.1 hypothetical protein PI124_g17652 [Phytophthora idaei]